MWPSSPSHFCAIMNLLICSCFISVAAHIVHQLYRGPGLLLLLCLLFSLWALGMFHVCLFGTSCWTPSSMVASAPPETIHGCSKHIFWLLSDHLRKTICSSVSSSFPVSEVEWDQLICSVFPQVITNDGSILTHPRIWAWFKSSPQCSSVLVPRSRHIQCMASPAKSSHSHPPGSGSRLAPTAIWLMRRKN